jgi:hypothetical protein
LVTIFQAILIEVGVWHLAQRLLPSERQYHALRAEVDRFLQQSVTQYDGTRPQSARRA